MNKVYIGISQKVFGKLVEERCFPQPFVTIHHYLYHLALVQNLGRANWIALFILDSQ